MATGRPAPTNGVSTMSKLANIAPIAPTACAADSFALAISETLTRKSSHEDFVLALQTGSIIGNARKTLAEMCDTMAGALFVAEVLTLDAERNAETLAAYQAAKAAKARGEAAADLKAPDCETTYILIRRWNNEQARPFTVSKRDGAFIPVENVKTAKSEAASGERASRKVSESREDITGDQACKRLRHAAKLTTRSNLETVAFYSALLAEVSDLRAKLAALEAPASATIGKRAKSAAKRAA